MKHILFILLLFVWAPAFGQTLYTTGVTFCASAPIHNPGTNGAKWALDTTTWNLYIRSYGTTWTLIGNNWVQDVSGCSAPAYTPTKFQSRLAINACDPKELYAWDGSAWDKIAPSTAGITGTGLTNRLAYWTSSGAIGYESTLLVDSVNNRLKIGNQVAPVRTLDVTGEARISDLTTDTPTRLVGADADGDLGEVALSGLSMVSGTLTNSNTGTVTGTGLANKLTIWNGTSAAGYGLGFSVDTTTSTLTLGKTGLDATLAFRDTSNTRPFITVNGQRFMHMRGETNLNTSGFFIGYQAGNSAPALGATNTFRFNYGFGYRCGASLIDGAEENLFIGHNAGAAITTADKNLAIGYNALSACVGCTQTIAIGTNALANGTTTTVDNVVIGRSIMSGSSFTGNFNTVIGSGAATNATSSDANIIIGRTSGGSLRGGDDNHFIGYSAGFAVTHGNRNIFIGRDAGSLGANMSSAIKIGYQAGSLDSTSSTLYIESSNTQTPLIGGSFSSNFVGINTLSTGIDAALEVTGTGATSSTMGFDVSNSNDSIIIAARNDRRVGINTATPDVSFDMGTDTDGFKMQAGTTAQRPSINNTQRVNTDSLKAEIRLNGTWETFASGFRSNKTLDFPNTVADSYADLTLTVTGASTGDVCSVGVPTAAQVADAAYSCFVSATNVVTVRLMTSGTAADPGSGTFKVFVIK